MSDDDDYYDDYDDGDDWIYFDEISLGPAVRSSIGLDPKIWLTLGVRTTLPNTRCLLLSSRTTRDLT